MIPLLLAILAATDGCGPVRPGLPWTDYCWELPEPWVVPTPKVAEFPLLSDCIRGPRYWTPSICRARCDYDNDGDVDLADFAVLQAEGR